MTEGVENTKAKRERESDVCGERDQANGQVEGCITDTFRGVMELGCHEEGNE
jgi:ketol-acid reductoisomerase